MQIIKKSLVALILMILLAGCNDRAKFCRDMVSRGVMDDMAFQHCAVSAEKGDAVSQAYYGIILETMGLYSDAETLYFEAISQKNSEAIKVIIGNMLRKGNVEEIIKYASKACDFGDQQSCLTKREYENYIKSETKKNEQAAKLRQEREAFEQQKAMEEAQLKEKQQAMEQALLEAKSELQQEREALRNEIKAMGQAINQNNIINDSIKMPTYTPPAKEESKELKFNEGVAYFKANNGLYGFVNKVGSIVIEPKFKGAGGFYNGRAVVQTVDGLWGYIDKESNWIVKPQFCMAGRFSEGLAAVYVGGYKSGNECYGGKWGYITVTGKMAIEPRFDRAWYFSKDGKGVAKAKVEQGSYTGYINGRGEWVD